MLRILWKVIAAIYYARRTMGWHSPPMAFAICPGRKRKPTRMETSESKQTASQDLFERVVDKVNRETIRTALSKAKDATQGDFGVSGGPEDLIGHLRRAVAVGGMTNEQVYALLQEGEENGGQTILYYYPKNEGVRQLCSNPEEVAKRLFGDGWRTTTGFPRLTRLEAGWDIVDFRTPYAGKSSDWLMKVYTFQESTVPVKSLDDDDEVKFALKLKNNEYAVIYERRTVESVCIARWNSHAETPLLELRIELVGRLERFQLDINALWTRLKPVFGLDDFEVWDLRRILVKMLRECQEKPNLYQLGLVNLRDSGEGSVRYTPYTERDPIDTHRTRLMTIHQLLDDGGQCDRLVMNWMADGSGDAIAGGNLRTYAGSRGTNELVIRAQTTEKAVNYVTDQLRTFTG